MRGHRDLIAWQKAMQLAREIYVVTRTFPKDEVYGLTSQLRRAAVSVPSNVAEGHGRTSRKEFHHFVGNARGSLLEVETQLELAIGFGYITEPFAEELLAKSSEVGRLLNGLLAWTSRPQSAVADN